MSPHHPPSTETPQPPARLIFDYHDYRAKALPKQGWVCPLLLLPSLSPLSIRGGNAPATPSVSLDPTVAVSAGFSEGICFIFFMYSISLSKIIKSKQFSSSGSTTFDYRQRWKTMRINANIILHNPYIPYNFSASLPLPLPVPPFPSLTPFPLPLPPPHLTPKQITSALNNPESSRTRFPAAFAH